VHDRLLVDVIDGGQGALREFLFGDDAYVAQHGAGELGEEALDEVQPRAMLRSKGKFVVEQPRMEPVEPAGQ
jgi:hypothetical protein